MPVTAHPGPDPRAIITAVLTAALAEPATAITLLAACTAVLFPDRVDEQAERAVLGLDDPQDAAQLHIRSIARARAVQTALTEALADVATAPRGGEATEDAEPGSSTEAAHRIADLIVGEAIRLGSGDPWTIERSARGGRWVILRDPALEILACLDVTFAAGGALGSLAPFEDPPESSRPVPAAADTAAPRIEGLGLVLDGPGAAQLHIFEAPDSPEQP